VSSVSNGLYFLTVPLVSVMRIIYTSKAMLKKFWGAHYLSKNMVYLVSEYPLRLVNHVLFVLDSVSLEIWMGMD
jgi:hypothetical protein